MSAPDGKAVWQLIGPNGAQQTVQHRYVADDLLTLSLPRCREPAFAGCPTTCATMKSATGVWCVLPDWAPTPGIVHAVFPSRRGLAPAVRHFLDFLGESMPGRSSMAAPCVNRGLKRPLATGERAQTPVCGHNATN